MVRNVKYISSNRRMFWLANQHVLTSDSIDSWLNVQQRDWYSTTGFFGEARANINSAMSGVSIPEPFNLVQFPQLRIGQSVLTSTRMIRVSTSFGRSVIKRMNKPRHNPKHMCRAFWSTSRTGGALRGRSAQISKQGKSGLWAEGSIKSGDLQEMQSVGQTPNKISAPHRAPSRD